MKFTSFQLSQSIVSNTLKQSIDPGRQSRDGPLAVNDNERELDP